MSLREAEAIQMVAALDDYEHLAVTDIGGTDQAGYWLCVTAERFEGRYEIASHCDYWDFVSTLIRSSFHWVANSRQENRKAS